MTEGIPDFLKIPQEERAAAWKGRRFTVQGAAFKRVDAAEDKIRKQLQRENDRIQAEKRAARLAALREKFNG